MSNKDNPSKGARFEETAKDFFKKKGIMLQRPFPVEIGVNDTKGLHKFDLGANSPEILVECKSHVWTEGGNAPAAKMSVWNEAMFYFLLAPKMYRKILFVKKSTRGNKTLAAYYIERYEHLIPRGVEIWEYDEQLGKGQTVYPQ